MTTLLGQQQPLHPNLHPGPREMPSRHLRSDVSLDPINFYQVPFTPLDVEVVDGKAMVKVSSSPHVAPPEALLFLEEDMVPTLDMGALQKDRVDNLYAETSCPYWDPRLKGNLISRVDFKTKLPVSRAGRVTLTLEEAAARETLRQQIRNRKRHLQARHCWDIDLLRWQQWKKDAKAMERHPPAPPATPPEEEEEGPTEEEFYSDEVE